MMISLVRKLSLWQTNAAQTRPAETGITNLRSKGYFEIALQHEILSIHHSYMNHSAGTL